MVAFLFQHIDQLSKWPSLQRVVAGRATIKNTEVLERIALYLLSNTGQLISINKIANTLRSSGLKVSSNTIENYLELLHNAFSVL